MKFTYIAQKPDGQRASGTISAASRTEARQQLTQKKLMIISLRAQKKKRAFDLKKLNIGWVKKLDIVLFTKNLAVMLKAGLTMIEVLEISTSQASGKLKSVLKDITRFVMEGNSLADSLAYHPRQFKNLYTEIVRIGEKSGSLEENLANLSVQLEKEVTLRRKIQAALIYPVFILISTAGLGIILATFVLPRLTKLFISLDMKLPLSTKILLWVATLFQNYGLWIVISFPIVVALIVFLFRLKALKPIWHYLLLNFPLVEKLTRTYNLAHFTRNLNILLKSGLPIDESLNTVVGVFDNVIYKRELSKVLSEVKKGGTLSNSIQKNSMLFPPMVVKMVNVGEKSGQLEEILAYLANFYEEEIDSITKNLSAIIEPLLLITIGLIVGFVGISIITPIYQVTGSIHTTF